VQLLDLVGKKMAELHFSSPTGTLAMKEYTAGTYVLLITDLRKGETITRTIVKQ
jgi:hypothetical protein